MLHIVGGHFVLIESEISNAQVGDHVHIARRCTEPRKVVKDFLFCSQKNSFSRIQRALKIASVRLSRI